LLDNGYLLAISGNTGGQVLDQAPNMENSEVFSYTIIARLCGAGAAVIGIAGLLGWILDLPVLSSIVPGYKPIAISMSIIVILLGGAQVFIARRVSSGLASILSIITLFITLFGLLEIIQLLTGLNATIENEILRRYPALYIQPDAHISPVAGILTFLIALAQSLLLYRWVIGGQRRDILNFVGATGTLVIIGSALFFLSYLFLTPLLYGTVLIPIAFTATIATLLLGIGLVATAGCGAFPLLWFAGTSTRARLLRAFLPLGALALLLLSLLQYFIIRLTQLNPAITAAALIILFEVVIGAVLLQMARAIGNQIDRAEEERRQAVEELRQLAETQEQRVRERTAQLSEALEREQGARMEAESARSYFQGLLEAAPDSIVIVNADGCITLINNQTEQLSGYTREELMGRPVEMLIPERFSEIHVQHRADYMAAPRARPMGIGLNLYLRCRDGKEIPVEISLSPFRTPEGTLVTASIRDISARKRAEAEINRLNEELRRNVDQLQAANKELEAFSYSVSHDLRAPLRGIDGFSKVLLEQYLNQLDERGRDYLTRVRAASQRMGRLIDDMLNLSRIGRKEMERTAVNLSEVAAAVIEELRQRDPERRAEVEIAPDLRVSGDADLLRIVLNNLLGNAWKFTGGRETARIEVGRQTMEGEPVYYVRDNGAGFDMAYADKLFTPFQQLHTEAEFPGTGIGLAIVQRIITRHGGRVWAEGEEGKGATIFFTLGER